MGQGDPGRQHQAGVIRQADVTSQRHRAWSKAWIVTVPVRLLGERNLDP